MAEIAGGEREHCGLTTRVMSGEGTRWTTVAAGFAPDLGSSHLWDSGVLGMVLHLAVYRSPNMDLTEFEQLVAEEWRPQPRHGVPPHDPASSLPRPRFEAVIHCLG